MPFHDREDRRYLTFDIFDSLPHAVFTRRGGVSPQPWASLNVGGGIGDEPERVRRNRYLSFETLGRSRDSIYDVWQVHSAEVVIAERARDPETAYRQADAVLTDNPSVTLFMRFADCTPILLHDPVRKVVGLVHAGWQGTVKGTLKAAVEAMRGRYGTDPADLLAAIGPSIGPDHYEIGPDVIARVHEAFGQDAPGLLSRNGNGSTHFDLWAANRLWLEAAGVRRVETSALCTACHLDDWFSHRAEHGRTGRFGALIALQP